MQVPSKSRSWALWLAIIPAIVISIPASIYGLTSIVVLSNGGFRYKEVFRAKSPDSSCQLIISIRSSFPADDVVTPSSVLKFEVLPSDRATSAPIPTIHLVESSDFQPPHVSWNPNSIRISAFDEREPQREILVGLTSRSTRTLPL